jgi:hypothetical protein
MLMPLSLLERIRIEAVLKIPTCLRWIPVIPTSATSAASILIYSHSKEAIR